jgi:intron-binding protein aquarius
MEEAAQVQEVETLIPMLLQNASPGGDVRLKRVVLIGDHLQLPPVVKHSTFQKYSSLDQSMFSRLIRLGVPAVLLDRQGRARADIAALYSWRYQKLRFRPDFTGLGNLEAVTTGPAFSTANTGFAHTFQLIDVPAFQGKGETTPTPFYYQNLGEAEYVVAVYQFMRLMGYPAEKISILTTYNGQRHLIHDILRQRCRSRIFGMPARVATVDKYQGQQNDYVLLSLVRTESVGHLRDVRRLVVALSRARLGLYIFCRQQLFETCYSIRPALEPLLARPTKLELVVGEDYPCSRPATATPQPGSVHVVQDVTAMGVLVYQIVQKASIMASDNNNSSS